MPVEEITAAGAGALIPVEHSRGIIQEVTKNSKFLSKARKLRNMSTGQMEMNVLENLPAAYFVESKGLKRTTSVSWEKVTIKAKEIAVIVPIPDDILDDASYPIFEEMKPLIVESFYKLIDETTLFSSEGAPAEGWPDPIATQAIEAGNVVDLSTVVGGGGDVYDAVLGKNGVVAKLEQDGYFPNGYIGAMSMRSELRSLRTSEGHLIFSPSVQNAGGYMLDGRDIDFVDNTEMMTDEGIELIAGDWNKVVWSLRQDMTYKVLTEGVIQDSAGNIVYNLAQQDMRALRCVMRLGWALPNPPTRLNPNKETRFPFSVLVA